MPSSHGPPGSLAPERTRDQIMDKLLWLRKHCQEKARWHRDKARNLRLSVNAEFKAKHTVDAAEAEQYEKHWRECAEQLEVLIAKSLENSVAKAGET